MTVSATNDDRSRVRFAELSLATAAMLLLIWEFWRWEKSCTVLDGALYFASSHRTKVGYMTSRQKSFNLNTTLQYLACVHDLVR
jgi:hypothetical protein